MQIGPYLIEGELGRGGTGIVYRALAPDGRHYALKLIATQSSADDELRRRRIGRELEALRRIDHPGVVRAVDSGWHGHAFYIVMVLIKGASLGQLIEERGPFPPGKAAALCGIVARTLHHLHLQGIVHRDVKPDNVMMENGYPRLTDLGLVRLLDDDQRLTKTGTITGTPGFCAPELLSSKGSRTAATPPSPPSVDVYGVGATLYALLTGRPPFEGNSHVEIAVQTVDRPATPPSQELRGSTSTEIKEVARLDAICLRCLSKDPGDRYASALDLALDLESALEEEGESTRSPGLVLAGLIPLLLLGVGAAAVLRSPGAEIPVAGKTPAPRKVTPPQVQPPPEPAVATAVAPSRPLPLPSAPAFRTEVSSVEDLSPFGPLAPVVWKGRHKEWEFRRTPDGFCKIRALKTSKTVSYFHLGNKAPGGPLRASVTVEAVPGGADAAGLLYGRPDKKAYALLGVTPTGVRFVKIRTPSGLKDRLSGRVPQGPVRLGVRETGRGLAILFDGKQKMVLGGGELESAVVGVFVAGGAAKFRDFQAEWR